MRNRRKRQGFTLIELMVVLAILGLLFALVGPNIFKQQAGAKIKVASIQLKNLRETLKLYKGGDAFPASLQDLVKSKDLGSVPKDPWNEAYVYEPRYSDDGERVVNFNLFSKGPDRRKDTADDIGNSRMQKTDQ